MMSILVIFSGALFLGTLVLLYLNWRILRVTERLLDETETIRKDTKVMRKDTRRVADSFDIQVPVPVYPKR
jgi:hypothetical protein